MNNKEQIIKKLKTIKNELNDMINNIIQTDEYNYSNYYKLSNKILNEYSKQVKKHNSIVIELTDDKIEEYNYDENDLDIYYYIILLYYKNKLKSISVRTYFEHTIIYVNNISIFDPDSIFENVKKIIEKTNS